MKGKIIGLSAVGLLFFLAPPAMAMPYHPNLETAIKAGTLVAPDHDLEVKDTPKGVDFSKIQKSAQGIRSFKTLVILADFPDNHGRVNPAFFDNLVFGTNASNTVREFYRANSYGQLDLVAVNMPSSLGWKRVSQNYDYYVGTQFGLGSYPQNSQKLAEELVDLVDPYVNFAEYDNDGDGFVDGIVIAHAGSGEEFGANNGIADIWSHKWGISPVTKDGVLVSAYAIQPEYWLSTTVLQPGNTYPGDMTIGVYAHEIGHLFGLPDLYDTDLNSGGTGDWSIMSYGSWSGTSGNSPANFDAWSKSHPKIGFLTPQVVQNNGAINLPPVETYPAVLRINPSSFPSTQYFLLENRQKIGYDSTLPGSGLLIWHIDETKSNNTKQWYPGYITSGNYKVALEQADGLWGIEKKTDLGDTGDPFPGSTGKTRFDDTTSPDSKSYSGASSNFGIAGISNYGANMTGYVSFGGGAATACGDLNKSGAIDIVDVSLSIDYAFRGVVVPFGVDADMNDDGSVSIFDVVEIINHAFRGYAAPDCLNTPAAMAPPPMVPILAPSVPAVTAPPANVPLKIGQQIQTADYLKVRVKPFGIVINTVSPNTRGEVVEGPNTYGGYRWWKVKYANGVIGWSADNWMKYPTGSITPSVPAQSGGATN